MFVPKFALLVVLGYAVFHSSLAATTHSSSSHSSPIPHSSHTKPPPSSLTHLSSAKSTSHTHKTTPSASLPSTLSTITATTNTTNTTASITGTGSLTTTPPSGLCPTYTRTLEAKRCPQLQCGPRPMAQVGGLGGAALPPRCVVESTTTIPCGCPTPMVTTTVLGGCNAACPPQGCQVAWVTEIPRGC